MTKQVTMKPVTTPPIRNKNKPSTSGIPVKKHISDDLADLQWLTTALHRDDEPKSPELITPVLLNTPIQNEWITLDEVGNLDIDIQAV